MDNSCARTTEAVRRAIQNSKESIAKLAERYNLNYKTVVNGENVPLLKMLQRDPRSTARRRGYNCCIVQALDDCLYAL